MALTITGVKVEFRVGYGTKWIFALLDGTTELGPFRTNEQAMAAVVEAIEQRRHAASVAQTIH